MGHSSSHFNPLALAVTLALAAVPSSWAGDILRGGTSAAPTTNAPTATSGATTALANKAQANAADSLARTTAALQSVRAMQTAARRVALAAPKLPNLPSVPNGLVTGGLVPTTGINWVGANKPIQIKAGGTTKVTIVQTSSQALLNWQTFNIGKQTAVTFDQKAGGSDAGKWIAFNQINDPSGNPTQILGSLDAIGQVYLINQNGILFGGSSQVNLHNLTASSLPINYNLVSGGLLNQTARNVQFLFSAKVADPTFTLTGTTYTLAKTVAGGSTPMLSFDDGTAQTALTAGTDYTLGKDGTGKTVVTFTPDGATKVGSSPITAAYTQATGDVVVQAGARLTSPTTPAKVGGRINLIGPNVTNQGTLSAPDGQVILAAGREVGFVAHSQDDASLRGLDVFVGQVDSQSGIATNQGLIDIPRGNATLAARNVNQSGVIDSTTSVSLNGSVDLLANYGAVVNPSYDPTNLSLGPAFTFVSSGTVTLGKKSVTRILPELDSLETAVGTQLALPSRLLIQGLAIYLQSQAAILAPNANATISAGNWNFVATQSTSTRPTADFINAKGQVYFESGAEVNVAGTTEVPVAVTQNILNLQLRGAELADSPVQRNGVLRGITLNLDIRNRGEYNGAGWIGTPLGDATGFAGLIQRSVGELTTSGGTVTIKAGSSVVMQPGSTVNSSGGSIRFESGMVETTRVLSDGRLYDIAQATPDRVYEGIYTGKSTFTSAKYGITDVYSNPLALKNSHFEDGYLQGADGGKITITAPSVALDGELIGQTVASVLQRNNPAESSELAITFQAQQTLPGYPGYSPTPPTVTFANTSHLQAADPFKLDADGNPLDLRIDRQKEVVLSPELFTRDGFGKLTISNGDGDIIVPAGLNFQGPAAGKLVFEAANISVASDISTPGGSLSFTAYNISPTVAATLETTTPAAATDRGLFQLAANVSLNTAGLILDERQPDALDLPLAINGGSISIKSFSATLPGGSELDVSGGIEVSPTGKRTYGTAGSISILAGRDPNTNAASVIGGKLLLGATLQGYGGNKGGSLALQSQIVRLGGSSASESALSLSPEFFSTGGFTNFTVTGIGSKNAQTGEFIPGLVVAANTIITPVAQTWLANVDAAVTLDPFLQPEGVRPSVSLALNSTGATNLEGLLLARGELVVGHGVRIEVGPSASVSLKGKTVALFGSIVAPGGKISVTADGKYPVSSTDAAPITALPTLYLASGSLLSTEGTTIYTPDAYGRRTGSVLDGGSIAISGNIVAEQGAILNVSGTAGVLDLAAAAVETDPELPIASGVTSPLWSLKTVSTRVESNAGSITFAGAQELFIDATLLGKAGGPTALGGSLDISSGRFYSLTDNLPTPQDITLVVTQNDITPPHLAENPLGVAVVDDQGVALASLGHFSANTFARSGMDSLTLQGNVQFSGNVSILARRDLSVANKSVLLADAAVHLTAAHATLGTAFALPVAVGSEVAPFINPIDNGPYYIPPTYGAGSLTVTASLIEIGNLTLQGIGNTRLIADNGDIRGTGTFDSAGDLTIRAGQVYPTTAGHFTIASYDKTVLVAASSQGSATVTLASKILPPDFKVGSDLLGSKVAAISGDSVTLQAGANASVSNSTQIFAPGSITFIKSGSRQTPLSAGGQLDVYASVIHQNGVLRAPLGTINLGSDGSTARLDLIAGTNVPVAQELTLGAGSLTSVSGDGLVIPYGLSTNGSSFIDPFGNDIASSQLPAKNISLGGQNITISHGSALDISGGGDLFAYRFNKGNSGSTDLLGWNFKGAWTGSQLYKETSVVSYQGSYWYARTDLTADIAAQPPSAGDYWKKVPQRFAVIPNYQADFAPSAAFNNTTDPGYTNSGLNVGDKISIGESGSLPAGTYTLLPARYALLPGAVLVTPQTGQNIGTFTMPEGANLVSGYRFNDQTGDRQTNPIYSRFEVASSEVVNLRAGYENYLANDFLKSTGQRLPTDAGHLILQATQSMVLQGRVLAQGGNAASRAGLVDIASTSDILITDGHGGKPAAGVLTLDSASLTAFGAESLLVGGIRTLSTDADGLTTASINVTTAHLTVDNARAPLSAPEIILVSKESLTLAPHAQILQHGSITGNSDALLLGNADIAGSGDGVLLRVSSDPLASISRLGYSASTAPQLIIGVDSRIRGTSLILDSTSGTSLNPAARLQADYVTLDSGQICLIFDQPGTVPTTSGLILSGDLLTGLKTAQSLSLLSYSSIDTYGSGIFQTAGALQLHAGEMRGFNTGDGKVIFRAQDILLDNSANSAHLLSANTPAGTLEFDAKTIRLGINQLYLDQYNAVALNASRNITVSDVGGLHAQNSLTATTPRILAGQAATQSITAGGGLLIQSSGGASSGTSGLGASLTLQGSSVSVTSDILLPSGLLNLHATTGDLTVGGTLDVSGTAQTLFDVVRYTNAGQIHLQSDAGSVILGNKALASVAANRGGGNAGTLSISAPLGSFQLAGKVSGSAVGQAASFSLDTGSVADFSTLASALGRSGFTESQSFRLRTGDVSLDGLIQASHFNLSTDLGSIFVTGKIDASGVTGGSISLISGNNLTVDSGAVLTVHGEQFSHAGKGGEIHLEAGAAINGVANSTALLDLQSGSTIDLRVDDYVAGSAITAGSSAYQGQFTGKLTLRAPRNGNDIQIASLGSNIVGASAVVAEGFRVYTPAGGTLNNALRTTINTDATNYINAGGAAMRSKLISGNPDAANLDNLLVLTPGVEIINLTGNLTLGTTNSTNTSDWDLSTFRYNTTLLNGDISSAPGILTLRAAGDVILYNAISDGFVSSTYNARLSAANTVTPINSQSWSYHITAGADLTAADFQRVLPLSHLGDATADDSTDDVGSLRLGKNAGRIALSNGSTAQTSVALANRFQVIRTGSGDIQISTGRSVHLLNQFANIYTVGTQVLDATLDNTFDLPIPRLVTSEVGGLGSVQQGNATVNQAQYTYAGGNITLFAQGDIQRLTRDLNGNLVADSEKQMPTNWLDRRGAINPNTGLFTTSRFGEIASTSWWVDFSNFFEGVGALGGGNVTLNAGGNIANVDAVIPTNARMAGKDAAGQAIAPDTNKFLELGGGDLLVRSGGDLDAGIYYVEKGNGFLEVGGSITTNQTRSPSLGNLASTPDYYSESSWLPTTLFLGKGNFTLNARGDLLLGPIANTFLMPQGFNNTFWYKTYFSTYATTNQVNVSSLGGSVNLRERISLPGNNAVNFSIPILQAYYQNVLRFSTSPNTVSVFQPWLRLAESNVAAFATEFSLTPSSFAVTAFSSDINLQGGFVVSPASNGNIELLAGKAINGLQPNGATDVGGQKVNVWSSATINLSDANPASLLLITTPYAYQNLQATPSSRSANQSSSDFLLFLDQYLLESGATSGIYALNETKTALHGDNLLHANDREPARLYASTGDISGITFFSPKATRILAGNDITDIAFYLQNVKTTDVSVVSAGHDLIAYDAGSILRSAATASGNYIAGTSISSNTIPDSEAGDLQISGPGTLEVLAGGNLDLGAGGTRSDGTGAGITSIGNARNLNLPFDGANLIAGAGIPGPSSLSNSGLDFPAFQKQILTPVILSRYLPEIPGAENLTAAKFAALDEEQQSAIALEIFYRILRDAGRDRNDSTKPTFGTYTQGLDAIDALFEKFYAQSVLQANPHVIGVAVLDKPVFTGDITTQARDIRTKNGGSIDLLAPGGGLTLTTTNIGTTTIPPGVVTEAGGSISVFTDASVDIGISRIFTLRGGDIIIWSTNGDIAAGSSAKTVKSAPPTRVLIDAQSADVQTDLAGLATGGGIGVLATVADVAPGNVDLIAPTGTVDAGDAGIRASGNLNIAAVTVLNADNITVSGTTVGAPAPVAAPSLNLAVAAPQNTTNTGTEPGEEARKEAQKQAQENELPSIITVEVLGYGG